MKLKDWPLYTVILNWSWVWFIKDLKRLKIQAWLVLNVTSYSHTVRQSRATSHEWPIRAHWRGGGGLWTYTRWSKSWMDTLGQTVTLFTSLWRPSNKKRRNSWASCWLPRDKNTQISRSFSAESTRWLGGRQEVETYLQPTNLGAYFWIWLRKSDGLMASLFTEVHRFWVSFANSEMTH